MKTLCVFIFALFTAMTALPVLGTSILIQQPEVVVKEAPLIVEVVVKDITFKAISNISTGEAWITLSVVDKIAGDCPAEIVIRRGHVNSDLRFFETEWDPPYTVDEHFIICLFPTADGYSTMGLYNGKFTAEGGIIKGTQIGIDEFKQQIKEIHDGQRTVFPNELPRQTANGVSYSLRKQGRENTVMSAGSHLNGEFITWNFTWNTSYVPVQVHYNPSNAPSGAPDTNGIAGLATTAYSLWLDQYSFLTLQNASPFTTTAGRVDDDFSVISWYNPGNTNRLAETHTYPNDLVNGVFYGPNSNTGVDVWFNYDIGTSAWYFNQTPPSSRTLSQIDFVEVLAHELGHGIGLQHVSNSNSMMYPVYMDKTCPIRGETDGDLAGRVYQHTASSVSGNCTHSVVFSANLNNINVTGNVTLSSGKTLAIEGGKTLCFSPSVSLTVNGPLSVTGSSSQHVTFTGSAGSYWQGFVINNSTNSSLQYCDFYYAHEPICATNCSNLVIEHCTFQNSDFSGTDAAALRFYNSSPHISSCTITGQSNSWSGIRFAQGSTGSLNGCTIQNLGAGHGIIIQGNSSPTISGNTIQDVHYYGIILNGNGTACPYIYLNNLLSCGTYGGHRYYGGIYLTSSTATIKANYITNSLFGILCDYSSSPTSGTTGSGDNIVTDNDYGLIAYRTSNPIIGITRIRTAGQLTYYDGACNQIYDNSLYNVYTTLSCVVGVKRNWWGSDPPNTSKFYASGSTIQYIPWSASLEDDCIDGGPLIAKG